MYKDVPVNAILISVDISKSNNKVNRNLQQTFIEGKVKDYIHLGSYNLKIAETARQLKAITQTGLVKTLITEGLINIMLGLEIEQHAKDLNKKNTGSLTAKEMKSVRDLSELINSQPERDYGLSELAQEAGISQSKLQEGFKLMHNKLLTAIHVQFVL